jgi:mannose-6-phosphate isomerase-like protein (cupin superfamily)
MKHMIPVICLFVFTTGCDQESTAGFVKLGPEVLPAESYERSPEAPIDPASFIIKTEQMTSFYDAPGEAGYFAFGAQYGFDSMSFVITETHPHGGPPLHTHASEEAHVVLSGTIDYIIGEERFTASGPYIARVPANTPHTFMNSGTLPLNLIGIFPSNDPGYEQLGPNPLIEQ